MSEILINAEGVRSCVKYKSGKVCIWLDGVKEIRELPPHGDIKDTKDILDRLALKPTHDAVSTLLSIQAAVDESPTIIEASN